MKYINRTDSSTGEEISLSYKDYGKGKPIVLIHGWPLSKEMWEYQIEDLVEAGYRVVKYDRRGFGKSSKPWSAYDYDSLTDDLHAILEQLDLREVTLAGFSMGGGEAVRYVSKYGTDRVSKIALIGAVTPFMLKTDDNPGGVGQEVFDGIKEKIKEDRIGFLDSFGKDFFGVSMIKRPVSAPLLEYYRNLASVALPRATVHCVDSFSATDFREDLKKINIPTLIIHGDADKTVPIEVSGNLTYKMLPHAKYIVYKDAPHGLFYTHRVELNEDLIEFLGE